MQSEKREDPQPQHDSGRGVPWYQLEEYGYTIENFPSNVPWPPPKGKWRKCEMEIIYQRLALIRFVKAIPDLPDQLSMTSTSSSTDSQYPLSIDSAAFGLNFSQNLDAVTVAPTPPSVLQRQPTPHELVAALESQAKIIYDQQQSRMTFKPFRQLLSNEYPDFNNQVTDNQLRRFLAKWKGAVTSA